MVEKVLLKTYACIFTTPYWKGDTDFIVIQEPEYIEMDCNGN